MKCQIITNGVEISAPKGWKQLSTTILEQAEMRELVRSGRLSLVPFWKAGAIIDDPSAWRLVREGLAVPADEDCELAANLTIDQKAALAQAQARAAAGIKPEDFDLFDAGVISGYEKDGYAKGKNWHLYAAMRQ